mgnify:CR=1 FL=1
MDKTIRITKVLNGYLVDKNFYNAEAKVAFTLDEALTHVAEFIEGEWVEPNGLVLAAPTATMAPTPQVQKETKAKKTKVEVTKETPPEEPNRAPENDDGEGTIEEPESAIKFEDFIAAMQTTLKALVQKHKNLETAKVELRKALGGRVKEDVPSAEYGPIMEVFKKIVR